MCLTPKGIKGCSSDSQQDSKGSTVLVGAADPPELLPSNCSRLRVPEKPPDTGNQAEIWGDTACSEGWTAGGKNPAPFGAQNPSCVSLGRLFARREHSHSAFPGRSGTDWS